MKFSENWLREWINLDLDSTTLKEQITNSGIEVESISKFDPIFHNVLVGKIIACHDHFKFSYLKIATVDIGHKKILSILCAASNCRVGIKVAVAISGAILPRKKTIKIKKIYGIWSEGMLCSFFDLGLFFYTNSIIEFDKDVIIGDDVNNFLLLKDNVIKINTISNRPDSLSILGLSRDLAAINNFKLPSLKKKLVHALIDKQFFIDIKAKTKCVSCFGRLIQDININIETPFWMQKKLFLCDMLSENVIKNIINYVLVEIGQPLNVFNSDNINDAIIVRMANQQESILLKDNIKILLNENILVLSDRDKILCIPGNVNTTISEINKKTKNIFLSSCFIQQKAIFDIIALVNSNKYLEYYRCGIDSSLQKYAIEYATDLILKICGGQAGPISQNVNSSKKHVIHKIKLYLKHVSKKSGFFIKKSIILNILSNLNYIVTEKIEYLYVIPPSWRFDILIEEDVISDILRIYGYNNISPSALSNNYYFLENRQSMDSLLCKLSSVLINKGYYEIITYGFVDSHQQDIIFPDKKGLLILNPISTDLSSMRLSLWPGLIKTIVYNKNYKQDSFRFFETGLCFSIDKNAPLGIRQKMFLGIAVSGNFLKKNWHLKERKMDFYDLKGDVECVLESICYLKDITFQRASISGLHPNQSALIYFKNHCIGKIGAIDPRLETRLGVHSATFLFEMSLNCFLHDKTFPKIKNFSKFPMSYRDIAILVSDDIAVADIIAECKRNFINKKVEINLFDVYSCTAFDIGKKSVGINFVFQDDKKTLQDDEINFMVNNCIEVLIKKFQIILRK